MEHLRNLQFPSRFGDATATRILWGFVLIIVLLAAFFLAWLTANELAEVPSGAASWLGIVFGLAGLAATLGAAYLAALVRPFSVYGGVMTPRFPIKRESGKRIRHIMLSDIRDAKRLTRETGDAGVLFTLMDGTRFSIFDADLQNGGTEFLDQLVAAIEGTPHGPRADD